MPGIVIKGISKSFGATKALDSVSLSIDKGELFFLLGPSGCGKTTLLRILAGFIVPDSGTITVADNDLLAVPIEKRNIGMVFQNYSLWPHMTILDNVAYGLKMRGVPQQERETRAREVLAMVAMDGLELRRPAELSGGQQQRVALARALVYHAELILLDEPLSNLDAKLRREMRREITRLHRDLGITMIYVTHDQEEASAMADRVALMRGGRVEQIGTPHAVYASPRSVYVAQFFGQANALPATVTAVENDSVEITTVQGGLGLTCRGAQEKRAVGEAVTAIIRPANLEPFDKHEWPNRIEGTVSDREFSGSIENISITTPVGTLVASGLYRGTESRFPLPGNATVLCVNPHHIQLLNRDETLEAGRAGTPAETL